MKVTRESAESFEVTFDTSGRYPSAQVSPTNELIAEFVNDEIASSVMREDLVTRSRRARSGNRSNFGSNVFGIRFELDGVILEHNYLEGEPSVKIDLNNFIDIITAYADAQQRASSSARHSESDR